MSGKKTANNAFAYKDVLEFVNESSNCKLLSKEYKNSLTKMLFQCKCGSEFQTTFSQFKHKNKRQCNGCGMSSFAKSLFLKYEDVVQYIELNTSCTLLSTEYNGIHSPLKVLCECGEVFEPPLSIFKNGKTKCNNCVHEENGRKQAHSYEYVKFFIEVKSGSGCVLLSESYINNATKLSLRCWCGNNFQATFAHFRKSILRQCNTCSRSFVTSLQSSNTEEFEDKVYLLVKNEYDVLGKYVNARTKIKMRHEKCGHEWDITPDNFLSGRRCPQCNTSKGERKIRLVLERMEVEYVSQHVYDDCRNELPLSFDFYLPCHKLLIEYDGEHHFNPVDFGGEGEKSAVKKLEYTQHNDGIKNQYCKDNNIPLLRIPYWEFDNIEEILKERLVGDNDL